jgi:hypothetical protein
MRTAIALAVSVALAAGCGSDGDAPDPPCRSETVVVQQFPIQGFSVVENDPKTPEVVTLTANPAVIDGVFNVAAPGLDLGFGRTLAGDNQLRDIGAEVADPAAEVNRIDVYVDKPLPPDVAATLTWAAYRSDDNLTWTGVSVAGARFETSANRFEIRFAAGSSRYVKVVTRPLLPSATVEPLFMSVFVTELQTLMSTTTCTP